ncbi:unnamed protein product [Ixodes pacificus]
MLPSSKAVYLLTPSLTFQNSTSKMRWTLRENLRQRRHFCSHASLTGFLSYGKWYYFDDCFESRFSGAVCHVFTRLCL